MYGFRQVRSFFLQKSQIAKIPDYSINILAAAADLLKTRDVTLEEILNLAFNNAYEYELIDEMRKKQEEKQRR